MSSLISINNLYVCFKSEKGVVNAVNGLSLSVQESEIFGIVGESGSGKTVTGFSIMGLLPKNNGTSIKGEIKFKTYDNILDEGIIKRLRGREISMIFQDPASSLNPVFTIGEQIAESFRINNKIRKNELKNKTVEILKLVGI